MAVTYDSKGLSIDRGNPNSGQSSMKQVGGTLNWSGTSQYQTLIRFTKSGNEAFKFQSILWYTCSVRDAGAGAGGYLMNSVYTRYNVVPNDANVYNDQFTIDSYPSGGTISLPISQVSSTGDNQAYIRFELPAGWYPVVATFGGYIICNRWDLLSISYS